MEQPKKPIGKQLLIFVVTFGLAFFGTKYVLPSILPKQTHQEKMMRTQIDEFNKKFPMEIEPGVRAENIEFIDVRTVQYNMTLMEIDKNSPKVLVESLKKLAMSNTQKYYNENPTMKAFRDNKITVRYFVMDADGKQLFQFDINNSK
ncbi:hypothetical protein [Flavobacterium sp.]|uniref:hypothetical protein n=1 Tax=Flavobacterium sp. TaxID=239 RepID=UPI0039E478F1